MCNVREIQLDGILHTLFFSLSVSIGLSPSAMMRCCKMIFSHSIMHGICETLYIFGHLNISVFIYHNCLPQFNNSCFTVRCYAIEVFESSAFIHDFFLYFAEAVTFIFFFNENKNISPAEFYFIFFIHPSRRNITYIYLRMLCIELIFYVVHQKQLAIIIGRFCK